jgi:fucose permease
MHDAKQMGTQIQSRLLLAIAYIGFVSLGLPDPVCGVAWPSVRNEFHLTQRSFGLIFVALGCGYCVSGFFGGKLTHLLGLGNLLWLSSAFVAVAMFGSGLAPAWPVFVGLAVVWGLGSGGIDAGLNAYASKHFPARHMNWLHACYSLGATLGPLMMTAVLVFVRSWRWGYGFVGIVLFLMAALFLITRRRWDDPLQDSAVDLPPPVGLRQSLREPLVWLHVVLFFLYVGFEFTVGQWCYTLLTESRYIATETAGIFAGVYYGAIGVGRILSGALVPRLGLDRLLRIAMLVVLMGAALFVFGRGQELAAISLATMGLGLAPIFPCLMSRTPQRLGVGVATHAVGFQVSAGMVGAASMPGLVGLLVQKAGLEIVTHFALLLAVLLISTHEIVLAASKLRATSSA